VNPQPQPQTPKPQPGKQKPTPAKPEEPAPDEVAWAETCDAGVGKEEMSKKDLWDHFTGLSDKKATKPVLIFFYWPEEDTDDASIKNSIRKCGLIEKIFEDEAVRRASVKFHCLKCDFKKMSEELKKKYRLKVVPKILFFDVKGKRIWQLTNVKASPSGVAKKMNSIAAKCDKLLKTVKK
jgi:hypothetical protein